MRLWLLLVSVCLIDDVVLQEDMADNANVVTVQHPIIGLFQNKCIEDLGCFYTGPPFYHPIHRPISRIPTDELRTRFLLYTPSTPTNSYLMNLTKESVDDSNFVVGLPTKILIHGYTVQLKEDDVRFQMKDELLKEGAYNVILVDWTQHNKFPYSQAVANARVVGAQTAKLINLLMDNKGIEPQSIHLIGHSLGGQMSGWVGERIPNLGRITGLDPAGPFFQNAENIVRLDTTDATFVDVIHSNGGDNPIEGLGIRETIGHMDFFPNGGNSQPGCFFKLNVTNEIEDPIENFIANSCDHSRANLYFMESINNCTFLAAQCKSYSSFESGECTEGSPVVAEMGFRAQKLTGLDGLTRFYLITNSKSPFCMDSEN